MIIGVLNRKGGVGKTTVAINVAATFAAAGGRVLLVDADPQASALAWSSMRERDPLFAVVGMARPTLHQELPGIAKRYDVVMIDGAPGVNDLGRAAILASDLVLIPVQPSPYDVWAAAETVQLIREARQFRESLKGVFIINRKIANTAIGREVASARECRARHGKGRGARAHDEEVPRGRARGIARGFHCRHLCGEQECERRERPKSTPPHGIHAVSKYFSISAIAAPIAQLFLRCGLCYGPVSQVCSVRSCALQLLFHG